MLNFAEILGKDSLKKGSFFANIKSAMMDIFNSFQRKSQNTAGPKVTGLTTTFAVTANVITTF